ncbi:hypothetical protein HNR25_004357 [Streptomonospora salina]|uniref:Uncharacterized protein n=1 Tax=Streptomonospora salina TaxID=104205 RepID=A0A841EC95_9ACTN|nr:hypothetical protein [Streptomonospora salina]
MSGGVAGSGGGVAVRGGGWCAALSDGSRRHRPSCGGSGESGAYSSVEPAAGCTFNAEVLYRNRHLTESEYRRSVPALSPGSSCRRSRRSCPVRSRIPIRDQGSGAVPGRSRREPGACSGADARCYLGTEGRRAPLLRAAESHGILRDAGRRRAVGLGRLPRRRAGQMSSVACRPGAADRNRFRPGGRPRFRGAQPPAGGGRNRLRSSPGGERSGHSGRRMRVE